MKEYPRYVKMGESALRLRGDMYWCDGGEWGVSFKEGPSIYDAMSFKEIPTLYSISHMSGINKQRLLPISEKEWKRKTGHYVPEGYVFENGTKLYSNGIKINHGNPCSEIPLDGMSDPHYFDEMGINDKPDFMYLLIN